MNAYHKWLGIPPDEQPPDHYRLLGIQQFESDPDVISNAADQRMVFLRQFQNGENAEVATKLLNEVAAARLALLNPERAIPSPPAIAEVVPEQPRPKPVDPIQVMYEDWLAKRRREENVPTAPTQDTAKELSRKQWSTARICILLAIIGWMLISLLGR